MRKDVHIGLAIGGVLLAVLVVWGFVVSGSRNKAKPVALETTPNGAPSSGDHAPAADIPAPTTNFPADNKPADIASAANTSHSGPAPAPVAAVPAPDPLPPAAVPDKKDVNWQALLVGQTTDPEPVKTATPPLAASSDTSGGQGSGSGASTVTFIPPGAPAPAAPAPVSVDAAPAPAPSAPTAPKNDITDAAPAAHTHKVAQGETFSSIAKAVYGNSRFYTRIIAANPKVDPNRLRPGIIINLPDASEVKSASEKPSESAATAAPEKKVKSAPLAPPVDGQSEYRVVSGDSLYKISMHLYGSAEECDHLYDLNKALIGGDPRKLKVGMVLKIPSPPTVATSR